MRAHVLAAAVLVLAQASCVVAGPPRAGPREGGTAVGDRAAPDPPERGSAGADALEPDAVREPDDARARELASLVNAHRGSRGCEPLRWSPDLAAVATAHSAAMREEGFFGHVDPAGRDASTRVREAGITGWRRLAENLALTPRPPAGVLDLWLDSPGHRANIEDCALSTHGLGRVDGYWTHLFAG